MNDRELAEALVGRLRQLSRDEPDLSDDVRSAQRARLVAMAAVRSPEVPAAPWRRLLAGRTVDAPVRRWQSRLTAGLTGAALTLGVLAGVGALAQGAEPGDLLYDVKRGTEQTQLALASDSERGLTLLGFASTRLAELTELTGGEAVAGPVAPSADGSDVLLAAGADAATVRDVLATMDAQTVEGTSWLTTTAVDAADAAAFGVLADWTDQQRAGLAGLDVPAGAEEAAAASLALVEQVAARGAALQAVLACPAGVPVAGVDRLGPEPGGCAVVDPPAPPTSAGSTTAPGAATAPAPGGTTAATTAPGGAPSAVPGGQSGSQSDGQTGGRSGGQTGGQSGGGAPTTTPARPGTQVPLPTGAAPTTTPPLVDLPLPLPSTTICAGGLICIGD